MRRGLFNLLFILGIFCLNLIFLNQVHARTIQKDRQGSYLFDDDKITATGRIQTGYLTGTANEIVYDGSNSDGLLSKLIWEIDEQFMFGFGASIQQEWVVLHADAWLKATEGDGTMDDYDWLAASDDWSDWSHHDDTELTKASIYDINAEFLIPQISGDKFAFSGFLGYKRENFKWVSRGGSYIYTSNPGVTWRDDIGNFTPGELAISYEQTYYTPYFGIGARGSLGKFEFSGRFIASFWAKVEALDTHHMRGLKTTADMNDGEMIAYDIAAAYNFNDAFALVTTFSYTKYETMRANSFYDYDVGTDFTYVNGEGADLEMSMLSIALVYKF